MTYLPSRPDAEGVPEHGRLVRRVQARGCQCGGSSMNCVQGDPRDVRPEPADPADRQRSPRRRTTPLSMPASRCASTIADMDGASSAELYIDNAKVATVGAAPWVSNAPATLSQGNHLVKVIGYDIAGTPGEATVTVAIGRPCDRRPRLPGQRSNACVDGRCVAGLRRRRRPRHGLHATTTQCRIGSVRERWSGQSTTASSRATRATTVAPATSAASRRAPAACAGRALVKAAAARRAIPATR